jgi:hypothetical protein
MPILGVVNPNLGTPYPARTHAGRRQATIYALV